jgi:hypothetical protein
LTFLHFFDKIYLLRSNNSNVMFGFLRRDKGDSTPAAEEGKKVASPEKSPNDLLWDRIRGFAENDAAVWVKVNKGTDWKKGKIKNPKDYEGRVMVTMLNEKTGLDYEIAVPILTFLSWQDDPDEGKERFTPPTAERIDVEYKEEKDVNGVRIEVGWDGSLGQFVISFPDLNDKYLDEDLPYKTSLGKDKRMAKDVFDYVVAQAQIHGSTLGAYDEAMDYYNERLRQKAVHQAPS